MKITLLCFIYSLLVAAINAPALANSPLLKTDSELATAGYFQLSWSGDEGRGYVLQQSGSIDFSNALTIYQGPDTASLISGRANGTYYYRIRYDDQADGWSDVTRVEVSHHQLSRAFMFFILGAIVFVATLAVVVTGNRAHKY
jgi:hypothetical protein